METPRNTSTAQPLTLDELLELRRSARELGVDLNVTDAERELLDRHDLELREAAAELGIDLPAISVQAYLVIEQPHRRRTVEQNAAWYTEVELTPGRYPVLAPGPLPYFRKAVVDGTVVDESFAPMFAGVAYGPGSKRHVGQPYRYWHPIPDNAETRPEAVARFNEQHAGRARLELTIQTRED